MGILSHFSASNEAAIASLPTGSGKTALMFAIAFATEAERILIIEPSRFLRNQTKTKLEKLKVFKREGILKPDAPKPEVKEVEEERNDTTDWEDLRDFDAAVACPQTTSPRMQDVSNPPTDLFDLVLIDEAHHAAARTWRGIINSLDSAKRALFTATPFRRDRRKLPGKLVYHYPIGRALSDEIYRPLEYTPIQRGDPETLDSRIAEAASKKIKEEMTENPNAALLIRTDRIAKCEDLSATYQDFGIDAKIINSEEDEDDVEERLKRLREGDVDAAVVVGMMAEGIDIPTLKVAALHAPPQSLPFTLQIAGRMSRNPDSQSGPATLIASPGQVYGEARRLFQENRCWRDFIPDLVDEAVQDAHGEKAEVILDNPEISPVVPESLDPFFSVEVKRFESPDGKIHRDLLPLDLEEVENLPSSVESVTPLTEFEEGCTVLLTVSATEPIWGKDSDILDIEHDLIVFFHPPGSRLLFEASTSKRISKALSGVLLDETEGVEPNRFPSVLKDAQEGEYTAVGLENALGLTGSHPSYRMHMGEGSDSSVRPSHGSVYGPGHAVGKMIDGEYRGMAIQNRKIWAMRRESLLEFVTWCRTLANILKAPSGSGLPGLTFLAKPQSADDLFVREDGSAADNRPVGVTVSDRLFGLPPSALIQPGSDDLPANTEPQIEVASYNGQKMEASLSFREDEPDISLSFSPVGDDENWQVEESSRAFEIEYPSDGERVDLEDFLNESPPAIVMPEGGAIRGDYGWSISTEESDLSEEMFTRFDWDDTDIRKEVADPDPQEGDKNVLKSTITKIKEEKSSDCLCIIDDGSYEISDIILINQENKSIEFFHCKSSEKSDSGNRVNDWYELFGQSCRSHSWVRSENILSKISGNLSENEANGDEDDTRDSTRIVDGMGSANDVKEIVGRYRPNEWSFRVIAVQPGCKVDKLLHQSDSHVYRGLRTVRDWLDHAGADFHVWGSS
jgi:hypothetical protein